LDPEHQTQGDLKEYEDDLSRLANEVLQCLALALQIPESAGGRHFFGKSHDWDGPMPTTLRFLHYPPQDRDPKSPLAGSHTDYGSVTLLIQKDIGGLEIQPSRTHKDALWIPVPIIPDAILVSIGDLFQMWTNGLLKSTKHRVTHIPQQLNRSRYSIACFLFPNDDIKLEPIPSPLITQKMRDEAIEFEKCRNMAAREYLAWKLAQTYDYGRIRKENS
ncbi:hypothetical protein BX616_006983, partial [Lobosporangium transversale]